MLRIFKRKGTIIAEGLKIVGSVTAEGLVEVNGHIEGDLHCTSLVISPKASISGGVEADRVVVNGRVEGPIRGGEVAVEERARMSRAISSISRSPSSSAPISTDARCARPDQCDAKARLPRPERLSVALAAGDRAERA